MRALMRYLAAALTLAALPAANGAAAEESWGSWTSVEVEKSLPARLSAGASVEFRTKDNFGCADRWKAGVAVGWQPVKFIRVGVGYGFIESYSRRKISKEKYDGPDLVGYRLTPARWTPAHRVNLDLQATWKFGGLVKLSLRERYQLTCEPSARVRRIDWKLEDDDDGGGWSAKESFKAVGRSTDHLVRSRLRAAVGKKGWRVTPYVSVEFFNSLQRGFALDKVRGSAGGVWKFNPGNSLTVGYVVNDYRNRDASRRRHAVELGYTLSL